MTPRLILLLRGAFDLLFGLALVGAMPFVPMHGFARGGVFAVIDGVLGIVLGATLLRSRGRWLSLPAAADGVLRLLIGLLILNNPGMEKLAIGTAFFFSLVVVAFVLLGLGGIVYVLAFRPKELDREDTRAMAGPALVISLGTLLLGVGLGVGFLDEQKRLVLGCYGVLVGIALCASSVRLRALSGSSVH